MTSRLECAPADIGKFRTAIHSHLGLRFGDDKLGFLAEVLGRRLEARGQQPAAYVAGLEANGGASSEVRALARELTVTETYFFRNAEQFRALGDVALPELVRAGRLSRPLRILSAGCASGEEVYTLAMLSRERPELANYALSILGVDVNPAMLERAARGRYSPWALRETSPEIQSRYFRADGRELVLDSGIRASVRFEERNLIADDPAFWHPGAFDAIFCRNVVMYFAPEIAQEVVARFSRSLVPGGFLFLGYAETMRGLSQDFHLRHTHDTFYYQKRDATHPSGTEVLAENIVEDTRWPQASLGSSGPSDVESLGPDQSWIEIIRYSSERIESLTSRSPPVAERDAPTTRVNGARTGASFDLSVAVDLMRQERFGEASALLTRLPSEAERDADVLLLRAVLLTHGGDLAAAEILCQRIVGLDEMSAGAHYLMALCREDAGDRPGAAEHDRVAAYLDPSFAMPRLHLGLLARRTGDYGAARRELGEALSLLQREDAWRVLLFGGGFGRQGLVALCQAELRTCGGAP